MAYDTCQPRTSAEEYNDLRILVVISNRVSHPLLVCFLLRETGTSSDTEDDRKEHKSVKCPGDDQGQPHAEVVDLLNVSNDVAHTGDGHIPQAIWTGSKREHTSQSTS